MTDTAYFARLFAYDTAMNRQVLELLCAQAEVDERTRMVFAHLLQAKKLWLWRMRGDDYKNLIVWPELSWEECRAMIDESDRDWKTFLEELSNDDLAHDVAYSNSRGEEFRTPMRDIMTHVLIHGGYHRGQIASAVRRAGGDPINTDYITYTRLEDTDRITG